MNSSDAIRIVLDMILEGKKDEAVALLNAYALECGYRSIVNTILEPILKEIGNRWSKEHLSLAQGYVAGKVAEEILLRLKDEESLSTVVTTLKGPVILGNIEDDYHSLGRKMVSIFLEAAGWKVIDLGNDVTAKSFVD
jgi:methanogenic corrinoid protein MtbC1